MNKEVLIVDDDKKIAELIDFRLKKQGLATHCVFRGQDAIDYVQQHPPALVILDIRLPDVNGVEVLKELQRISPETYILMISAHADVKLAVDCMKWGAYDFIEKPLAFPELDAKISHVFRQFHLEEEVSNLKRELGEKYKYKTIIGRSPAMKKVFEGIEMAMKGDASVLIEGESGTGKELVARAIHFNGLRKAGPFVAVNCSAIPENLLESELFGHEKGAFTGALARKIGKFEQAQGGTIFLDEIGDLPGALQAKLLRVLQEREIERVGGSETIPIKARFVTATNQDLKKLVNEGKFREDLYFRIHVFPIQTPPLRERKEDIPELLKYFIKKHRAGRRGITLASPALKMLVEYEWPGNIRELENLVERLLLVKGEGGIVTEEDIHSLNALNSESAAPSDSDLFDKDKVMGDAERSLLENALKETDGNITHASRLLKISRDTFYRKMKKYTLLR